jgi:long-chain acyl-CoA synthetase
MNVAEWLAATARLHPQAPALLSGTTIEADYAGFARRASALGAALTRDFDVQPGDRVALFMSNCTAYLECLYAVWWIGAAAVPINAKLHGREAAWICDNAGATFCFVDDDSRAALVAVAEDLPASLQMLSVDSADYRTLIHDDGGAPATTPIWPGCSTPPAPPGGRKA